MSPDPVAVAGATAFPLYDAPTPPPPIAGIVPFSSVDWPGRLAATVFLRGCPWRCPYCHNPHLQGVVGVGGVGGVGDAGDASGTPWAEFIDLLGRRRGLLDGVVLTGGEPTMHRGLGDAIDAIHASGFDVGLHTSGCYPAALRRVLAGHRPEWIGLDVKADPRDAGAYAAVAFGGASFGGAHHGSARFTGAQLATGDKVMRSLRMILAEMSARPDALRVEVRTTVWPDSPAVAGLPGIADMLADELADIPADTVADELGDGGAPPAKPTLVTWAIQKARPDGVSPDAAAAASFRADRPGWAAEFDALVADARERLSGVPVTVIGR